MCIGESASYYTLYTDWPMIYRYYTLYTDWPMICSCYTVYTDWPMICRYYTVYTVWPMICSCWCILLLLIASVLVSFMFHHSNVIFNLRTVHLNALFVRLSCAKIVAHSTDHVIKDTIMFIRIFRK